MTYVKGALFFRALEQRIGRPALDLALSTLYARWVGEAAGMQDLLDVIYETSGYDAGPCAGAWLKRVGPQATTCE